MTLERHTSGEPPILILPPTRRDGEVTRQLLLKAALSCEVCVRASDLAARIGIDIGAVLVTDALFADSAAGMVVAALAAQPPWSDIPIVLLARSDPASLSSDRLLSSLTNVTILERPTSTRTLLSSLHAALRTRLRQYQMRDQIAALKAADDALRAADRRKDEFLAMLAHELRNPLSPILTASEVLSHTAPSNPQIQTTAGILKRQARHLTRLVDDLLDVSRITQGRIHLQRRKLGIAALVSQAVESVESMIRDKKHRLRVELGVDPLYVEVDGARVVQCMTNILSNAAKYTDAGGEIELRAFRNGAWITIAVTDNGIGISKDLLPRMFDLFVQGERALDRSDGGLGIGLSVVKRLVEMHGGEVAATSEGLGRGVRIEMRLPAADELLEEAAERTASPPPSRRILVVDDNIDAARSLALLLALDGHVVETAYTAQDALRQVAAFAAEVVLLDIGMPDMDGYAIAAQLRCNGYRSMLVAVTGYGRASDIEQGRHAGFDLHLVKPVDRQLLNEALDRGVPGRAQAGGKRSQEQRPDGY